MSQKHVAVVPAWLLAVVIGVGGGNALQRLGPSVTGSFSYSITFFMYAAMITSGLITHSLFLVECGAGPVSQVTLSLPWWSFCFLLYQVYIQHCLCVPYVLLVPTLLYSLCPHCALDREDTVGVVPAPAIRYSLCRVMPTQHMWMPVSLVV